MAAPLALLCLDVFAYSAAGLAYQRSHVEAWNLLDHALSPWLGPLVLRFVLAFVGKRRAFRVALVLSSIGYGLLSLAAVVAFVVPELRPFVPSPPETSLAWSVWFFSVTIPSMTFAVLVVVRHLRANHDAT